MWTYVGHKGEKVVTPKNQAMEMIVIRNLCLKFGESCQNIPVGDDHLLETISERVEMLPSDKASIGGRLVGIIYRVVYGDPKEVRNLMGLNTAYVERTKILLSRQMNGRMVRKILSFSKKKGNA
jgi:hypothetical protein